MRTFYRVVLGLIVSICVGSVFAIAQQQPVNKAAFLIAATFAILSIIAFFDS